MSKQPLARRPKRTAPLVLIADDVQDTREMYALYLSNAGFRVATAVDGLDAVDKAIRLRPDLVVLDLAMPSLNGFEVATKLRSEPRMRGVAIIAVTAHGLDILDDTAKARWFDRFLTKPCLPAQLATEIRKELRGRKRR